MGTSRHTYRDVLKDNSGLSTSIAETLGALSLKTITMVMVGGLLASLIVFWGVTTATADTSSGFQTANLGFEKAVSASDVVVGINTDRIALLTDTTDGKCDVATWQSGARDGGISLRVDTKKVAGVCTPTTALIAPKTGDVAQELMFGIKAPAFTYSNLGGREITFNATGASTLVTGAIPAAVKLADWNDTRPYKVALKLETLDKDTALVTKKAVLSAFTNVVNISAAAADLRYVPAPSTDPIPGPLRITGVVRSTTTGTVYAGAREGAAVTVSGGVCQAGPTKISVSYTQQSPSATAPVSTVFSGALSGADTTVHLDSVPNGGSGAVEASATCIDAGAAEKASIGFTQTLPATVLTATQNAVTEKHDLSWVKVSSLPTSFELRWSVNPTINDAPLVTTTALTYQSSVAAGANLGFTSKYTIAATVDSVKNAGAPANVTNNWPAASAATSLNFWYGNPTFGSFYWNNGAACPAGTNRQTQSSLNLKWDPSTNATWYDYKVSAWGVDKFEDPAGTDILEGYPFGYSVRTKCVSAYSESPISYAQSDTKWNGWNTPAAPVYNAYTNHRKTEQPAGSVYDICRNHWTSTCSRHPGYGSSIQLIYNLSCPYGSNMGANNVHSWSWSGGQWDQGINTWDGWETGNTHRTVDYVAAYACKTPWGNQSPVSPASPKQTIWVWAW